MAGKLIGVCVGIFRWFPVVFVTAIIVWSYYAYVVHMCLFTVTNFPERVAYLVCYHPLVIMIVWSFWRSIFTEAAAVPSEFYLTSQELEEIQKNKAAFKEILDQKGNKLLVQSRTNRGGIRYCDICKCVKPDRSHHCSVCSRCILKMDHHCPWINNCVCYSNYKFFFLFLGYSLLCSLFVTATSCQYFVQFWMDASSGKTNMMQLNLVLLFFVGFSLVLGIGSLFSYQCSLLSENRTTLESLRTPIFRSGPDRCAYNRGCYTNFVEVFGKSKLLWFLPVFTDSGDGVNFIARISPVPVGYQSMDSSAIPIQSYYRVETTSVMVQPTSSPARYSGSLYASTIPVGEDKDKLLKHEPRNKSSDGANSDIIPEKQKRFM